MMPCYRPGIRYILALLLAMVASAVQAEEPLEVVYPTLGGDDSRSAYPLAVLKLALEASQRAYRLSRDPVPRSQARAITDLDAGGQITVAWMGTSAELESRLLPVRVPIWRGLLGFRLFLIARDRQPLFSAVRTIDDLRQFSMGQGIGWSDVRILDNAGLRVTTAPYETLFAMVGAGRIDAFPRGAVEATAELVEFGRDQPAVALERDLLLVYHFDQFFFTSRRNPALADAIRRGFEAAYDDGSFLALFRTHPDIVRTMRDANLAQRHRIDIPNPLLTPETAALPPRYWFAPEG
jgi:hypothetical protein